MKIEKTPAKSEKSKQREFIDTMLELESGEGFIVDKITQYRRHTVSILRYLLKKDYYTKRLGKNKYRVGLR